MKELGILITCETLDKRRGTELYIRDVALSLLRLGHRPIIYSSRLGELATEIRNLTVPVIDRLDALGTTPDLIYGQHHLPTMMALLHFANVPAVYVCHDFHGQNAFAPRFPRILRFVGVDVTCRDRLIYEDGLDESRVRLIPSFVDLARFKLRPPLPNRPQRALVFSNYTGEGPHLTAMRMVCEKRGIQLDVIGELMNNVAIKPEEVLKNYDMVFAKGRSALEALAVGCAVIIYSGCTFLGPMVRADDVAGLLPLNLGIRAMGYALTPEQLGLRVEAEVAKYDPLDAGMAATLARSRASQAMAMETISELCVEVVAEYERTKAELDPQREGPAAAVYLERLQRLHSQLIAQQQSMQDSTVARLNGRLKRFPRLAGALRPLARALTR